MAWNPPPWTVRVSDATGSLHTAIAHVDAARLNAHNPEIVSKMWSAWDCPASHLPWLAWSLSVDTWDPLWPEEVQRRVVAASPQVHRFKGTRAAVETAVEALYARADITEWFETDPPGRRGTFTVTAFVSAEILGSGSLLSAKRQEQLVAAIRASKPKSRVFDFQIGVETHGEITVGAAVSPVEFSRVEAQTIMDDAEAHIDIGAATTTTDFARIDAQTLIDTDFEAALAVGAAIQPVEFIKIEGIGA